MNEPTIKAAEIWAQAKAAEELRAEAMPTVTDAMRVISAAKLRLQDLGWNSADFCPKDGSVFEAIEFGCTAPFPCSYTGVWPTGGWSAHVHDDLWPTRPVMFRVRPDQEDPDNAHNSHPEEFGAGRRPGHTRPNWPRLVWRRVCRRR